MTHDEIIEVIAAHRDGKKIEYRFCAEWTPVITTPTWSFDIYDYRIAPEPKKRLIRVDELPVVCWVLQDATGLQFLVIAMIADKLYFDNGWHSVSEIHRNGYRWSPDRKTLHSFEVEEKV